jgi:hypothetical protein
MELEGDLHLSYSKLGFGFENRRGASYKSFDVF